MTKIVYCDKCGEYLGDRINGVLYKFGKVVTQPHVCEKEIVKTAARGKP